MKAASRFILPVEMLLGCYAIAWGISGAFGAGSLHSLLIQRHESLIWGILMVGFGCFALAIAMYEFALGGRWDNPHLFAWAKLRQFSAFLLAVSWIYAVYIVIHFDGSKVFVLTMTAPISLIFSIWCFWENKKVAYALNPDTTATNLSFYR